MARVSEFDLRLAAWLLGLYLRFVAWILRVERDGRDE